MAKYVKTGDLQTGTAVGLDAHIPIGYWERCEWR